MYSENQVTLIGHVGRVDVKTANGTKFAQMSLATHERWTNEDGSKGEKTNWVPLVTFKPRMVALIEQHIKKAAYLRIVGKLKSGSYEKAGETIYTLEVHIDRIGFLQPNETIDDATDEGEAA